MSKIAAAVLKIYDTRLGTAKLPWSSNRSCLIMSWKNWSSDHTHEQIDSFHTTHVQCSLLGRQRSLAYSYPPNTTARAFGFYQEQKTTMFTMMTKEGRPSSPGSRGGVQRPTSLGGSRVQLQRPSHHQHQHQQHTSSSVWYHGFLKWTVVLLVIVQALVYICSMMTMAIYSTRPPVMSLQMQQPPCNVVMNGNGNTYFGNANAPLYGSSSSSSSSSSSGDVAAGAAGLAGDGGNVNPPTTLALSSAANSVAGAASTPSSLRRLYANYTEQVAVIAKKNITYRFSPQKFAQFEANDEEQVIVGVLSRPRNVQQRNLVRGLWAHGHSNVFFIVGDKWTTEMEQEFSQYGDLIWMDMRETYRRIVFKTLAIYTAFGRNLRNYRHLLKTDDDSYVRLGAIEALSADKHKNIPYWGQCKTGSKVVREEGHRWYVPPTTFGNDTYPSYAMGGGYALSQDFVRCAVEKVATLRPIPIEDAQTGILAQACGIRSCELDLSISSAAKAYSHKRKPREYSIKWNTFPNGMIGFQHITCANEKYARYEKSCTDRRIVLGNNDINSNNIGNSNGGVVAFPDVLYREETRDYAAED
eukprot:scaffold34639_cov206-Amphora_coffeaeformis.AAC.7